MLHLVKSHQVEHQMKIVNAVWLCRKCGRVDPADPRKAMLAAGVEEML